MNAVAAPALHLAPPPAMPLHHLAALLGPHGVYEHARGAAPRVDHGYCTDDAARVLAFVVREPWPEDSRTRAELARLTEISLSFLESAVVADGTVHNRMAPDGAWADEPSIGDWWGRALYGLGGAVRFGRDAGIRSRALRVFLRAAAHVSPDVRASAFAVIGAAEVLEARPGTAAARMLVVSGLARVPRPDADGLWPERRLRYANGALCTALIAGGRALRDRPTVAAGVDMLDTLLDLETAPSGLLSFVGTEGRDRSESRRSGDQQPIEPAAIAEACLHALLVTGERRFAGEVLRIWAWFTGENEAGVPMFDPRTGAGYDGLEPQGRNDNRGAESTLAALSACQSARAVWSRSI